MKILAIRGKNLASLEDEFDVDFMQEPLKSAGIFAITGVTGSGKSTLLDTLCLALYDQSPRTKFSEKGASIEDVDDKKTSININDPRQILRRGATEGFAEVDFKALDGLSYRSRWSVKRARNKETGTLSASAISVMCLSENRELQGTKNILLKQIETLTGLSYTQFTRTVLLAQGEFASFMKAQSNEKAELLEKLTGTEIYSRISIAIYNKAKETKDTCESTKKIMDYIAMISPEELEKLTKEQEDTVEEIKKKEEILKYKQNQLNWFSENIKKSEALSEAQKAANLAIEEAKKNDSDRKSIEEFDYIQPIRDHIVSLSNIKKQLQQFKESLEKNKTDIKTATTALEKTQKEEDKAKEDVERQVEINRQSMTRINQARETDTLIIGLIKNTKEAYADYIKANEQFELSGKVLASTTEEISKCQEQINKADKWLTKNAIYAKILPQLSLVESNLKSAYKNAESVKNSKIQLNGISKQLETGRKQIEILQKEALNLEKILPAEIAIIRALLVEGEPCPVCGSIHHPSAAISQNKTIQQKELEQQKENNKIALEQQQNLINNWNIQKATEEANINNFSNLYNDNIRTLQTILSDLPDWNILFEQHSLEERLQQTAKEWEYYVNLKSETEQISRNKQALLAERTEAKNQQAEILTQKKLVYETNLNDLNALKEKRSTMLKGKTVAEAEEIIEDLIKNKNDVLKGAEKSKSSCAQKLSALNATQKQLQQDYDCEIVHFNTNKDIIQNWLSNNSNYNFEKLESLSNLDKIWIGKKRVELSKIDNNMASSESLLKDRQKEFLNHQESVYRIDELLHEALLQAIDKEKKEQEMLITRNAEITQILKNENKNRTQFQLLAKQYGEQSSLSEKWEKLNIVFGSYDGKKYKTLAQQYTLDILLEYANCHLSELNPRYSLMRITESLALQVIDHDMMDEHRAVQSLSGGESFLISLALALGLASLSSNSMSVESLFIDEGFGSLDEETLHSVMDALGKLQTQGRKIGIISHVGNIQERISTQIHVTKVGNGRSSIRIV